MVVWENQKIIDCLSIAIRKEHYCCDPEAMIINGLDLQQLQQTGMTEEEALNMMQVFGTKYFGDSKIILAGHNIKFDIAF